MTMIHALAGKPAPKELLVDIDKLRKEYYTRKPDITNGAERVSFGTSGHRGSSLRGSFNEAHVLTITQAICEYRNSQGINGPLYIGKDTHALSEPAFATALEVLAANGVETTRPSGTEDVYKLYAESFRGSEHLGRIQEEAQALISNALAGVMG